MKLVTRAQWGARRPKRINRGNLNGPVTAHWNGPTLKVGGALTWDHSRCASLVRGIQNYHMDANGWNDVAYNYLECPHGYTFEGRGLDTINGANGTNAGNRSSHAICSLAGEGNPFPDSEKQGFRDCVHHIARSTAAQARAIGHRDHKATACPGNERYAWVHSGMPVSGGVTPPTSYTPPEDTTSKTPLVRLGNSGDAVRRVQQILHDYAGGDLKVDGYFGPATKRKVQGFQRYFGLSDDGIVGPKTWAMLLYVKEANQGKAPEPQFPPFEPERGLWSVYPLGNKPLIKMGARGDLVKYLQGVIMHKAGGDVAIDGIFGPHTEKRVKDLQRFFKLSVDGIVGAKTWAYVDFIS